MKRILVILLFATLLTPVNQATAGENVRCTETADHKNFSKNYQDVNVPSWSNNWYDRDLHIRVDTFYRLCHNDENKKRWVKPLYEYITVGAYDWPPCGDSTSWDYIVVDMDHYGPDGTRGAGERVNPGPREIQCEQGVQVLEIDYGPFADKLYFNRTGNNNTIKFPDDHPRWEAKVEVVFPGLRKNTHFKTNQAYPVGNIPG